MHRGLQTIMMLLLIPFFVEGINEKQFLVQIPGFPFSLGMTLFTIYGIAGLMVGGTALFRTNIFLGLFLVYMGCTLGSFFSDDSFDSITRGIGLLLFLVATCGMANLWSQKTFRHLLDVFFIATFIYWSWYIMDKTLLNGKFISYSTQYLLGLAYNHHIPGMKLSVSTIYIAFRLFFTNNKLKIQGYWLIGFSMICCLLIESRSNLVFTGIALLAILLKDQKNIGRILLILLPLVVAVYLAVDYFTTSYDFLNKRFNLQDTAFQQRTNAIRVSVLMNAPGFFLEAPFGRGLRNVYFDVGKGHKILMHNQYITYILAGGALALAGTFLWVKGLLHIFKNTFSSKNNLMQQPFLRAAGLALFTFSLTLLTIEATGTLFFVLMSLGIFLSKTISLQNRRKRLPAINLQSFPGQELSSL